MDYVRRSQYHIPKSWGLAPGLVGYKNASDTGGLLGSIEGRTSGAKVSSPLHTIGIQRQKTRTAEPAKTWSRAGGGDDS